MTDLRGKASPGSDQRAILEALSRGELSTRAVMAKLDLDYSQVLDLMADHDLPLFQLPASVAEPMGARLAALIRSKGQ